MANVWAHFVEHLDFLEARLATLAEEERGELRRRSEKAAKSVAGDALFVTGFNLAGTVLTHLRPPVDYPLRLLMVGFYILLLAVLLLVLLLGKAEIRRVKRDGVVLRAKMLMLRDQAVEFAGNLQAEATQLGESPPRLIEFRTELLLSSIESAAESECVVGPLETRIWFTGAVSVAVVLGSALISLLG